MLWLIEKYVLSMAALRLISGMTEISAAILMLKYRNFRGHFDAQIQSSGKSASHQQFSCYCRACCFNYDNGDRGDRNFR